MRKNLLRLILIVAFLMPTVASLSFAQNGNNHCYWVGGQDEDYFNKNNWRNSIVPHKGDTVELAADAVRDCMIDVFKNQSRSSTNPRTDVGLNGLVYDSTRKKYAVYLGAVINNSDYALKVASRSQLTVTARMIGFDNPVNTWKLQLLADDTRFDKHNIIDQIGPFLTSGAFSYLGRDNDVVYADVYFISWAFYEGANWPKTDEEWKTNNGRSSRYWQYIGSPVEGAIPSQVFVFPETITINPELDTVMEGEDLIIAPTVSVGPTVEPPIEEEEEIFFGAPGDVVPGADVVGDIRANDGTKCVLRKYDESYDYKQDKPNTGLYLGKWVSVDVEQPMSTFEAYEFTQPYEASGLDKANVYYKYSGKLYTTSDKVVKTATLTPGVPMRGCYFYANSFSSPIDMRKLIMVANQWENLEKTVYLYTANSRGAYDRLFGSLSNGRTTTYVDTIRMVGAFPLNYTALTQMGYYMIPSMNNFMVKSLSKAQKPDITPTSTRKLVLDRTSLNSLGDCMSNIPPVLYAPAQNGESVSVSGGEPAFMDVYIATENGLSKLTLATVEGTTAGFDNGWDASLMSVGNGPKIYTTTDNGIKMMFSSSDNIDGTKIAYYMPVEGNGKLIFCPNEQMSHAYDRVILEDLTLGVNTEISLSDTTAIDFTSVSSSNENRFRITAVAARVTTEQPIVETDSEFRLVALSEGRMMVVNKVSNNADLVVFDAAGRKVFERTVRDGELVETGSLPAGVYNAVATAEGNVARCKVVKGK